MTLKITPDQAMALVRVVLRAEREACGAAVDLSLGREPDGLRRLTVTICRSDPDRAFEVERWTVNQHGIEARMKAPREKSRAERREEVLALRMLGQDFRLTRDQWQDLHDQLAPRTVLSVRIERLLNDERKDA